MFSNVESVQPVSKKEQDVRTEMIQSFLKERAVQKLIPERDSEIARITYLLDKLKAQLKEMKQRRENLAYRRMKTKNKDKMSQRHSS